MGTMGKTHGVNRATKPHKMASIITAQMELDSAGWLVVGNMMVDDSGVISWVNSEVASEVSSEDNSDGDSDGDSDVNSEDDSNDDSEGTDAEDVDADDTEDFVVEGDDNALVTVELVAGIVTSMGSAPLDTETSPGSLISNSFSVGGRQDPLSQTCHSTYPDIIAESLEKISISLLNLAIFEK